MPAQRDGREGRDGLGTAAQGGREYAGTLIRRAGGVRYEHDAQGRVTLRQQKRLSAGPRTWRYSWDGEDRLTGVTTPDGQRWRYAYDPFGRRITKQRLGDEDGVAEQVDFAWDGVVLAEQHHTTADALPSHVTTWDWEPGGFRPLTQADRRPTTGAPGDKTGGDRDDAGRDGDDQAEQAWFDAQFHAIITDLVGTPTELIDPDGDLVWQARTTLWGASPPPAAGDLACPLRFPGQYHDPETGLHYNYHRYYDPETARYDSTDPLGLAPAPNPHTYVPNPLDWFDPLGLAPYRLSDPLPRGMNNKIASAYDDVRAGRIPSHDTYAGHEYPWWAGSKEYRVPGRPESDRILEKELPNGVKVYGWTSTHYTKIQRFSAPHFPDSGWN